MKMIILWDFLPEGSLKPPEQDQSVCPLKHWPCAEPPRVDCVSSSSGVNAGSCLTAGVSWRNHSKTNLYDFISLVERHISYSYQVWCQESHENWWWLVLFESSSLITVGSVISAFRVWSCVQTTPTHNSTRPPSLYVCVCFIYTSINPTRLTKVLKHLMNISLYFTFQEMQTADVRMIQGFFVCLRRFRTELTCLLEYSLVYLDWFMVLL